jgi:hypothetical protein
MKELIAARPHLFDAYERAGEKLCPVIAAMCDDYRNARCTEMGLAREVWDKMSDESTPLRKRARLIAMLSGASTRSIRMSSMRICAAHGSNPRWTSSPERGMLPPSGFAEFKRPLPPDNPCRVHALAVWELR